MSTFRVCLKCEAAHPYYHDPRFDPKECPSCENGLIEIDDMMVPTIFELNRKGYETQYCCSGHVAQDYVQTYILFDDSVMKFVNLEKFTKGLDPQLSFYELGSRRLRDERLPYDNRYTLEYRTKSLGYPERMVKVPEINRRIYEWACGLEYLNLTQDQLDSIKDTRAKGLDYLSKLRAVSAIPSFSRSDD
jgi:hypothetical protein